VTGVQTCALPISAVSRTVVCSGAVVSMHVLLPGNYFGAKKTLRQTLKSRDYIANCFILVSGVFRY